MRIILQCHPRTHIVDMLRILKWMNLSQRLHYNLCIILWKIVNDEVPPYLQKISVSDINSYNTRASSNSHFYSNLSSPKAFRI